MRIRFPACLRSAPENEIYKIMGGNYVVLDHDNGEVSYFAHTKTGRVRVKAGDKVTARQQIGELGFARDAFIPHLHYMLIDSPDVERAFLLSKFPPRSWIPHRRCLAPAGG